MKVTQKEAQTICRQLLYCDAKREYEDYLDRSLSKEEDRRLRNRVRRTNYELRKAHEYDQADAVGKTRIRLAGINKLAKRLGAVGYEFYYTNNPRFEYYYRAVVVFADGREVRYYFHKGRWRKS